jgi:hypothetical protein
MTKIEFKTIPYSTRLKKWTGWELNPRPQPAFSKRAVGVERKLTAQSHLVQFFFEFSNFVPPSKVSIRLAEITE